MKEPISIPVVTRSETVFAASFWSWPRILLSSVLVLSVFSLSAALGLYASWKKSEYIAPGMVLQGEPVGGLTRREARDRLEKRFGRLFVALKTPERDYNLSLSQLGGTPLFSDAVNHVYWYGRSGSFTTNAWRYWTSRQQEQRRALPVQWDADQLRKTMWIVAGQYETSARDARIQVTNSGVVVVPEQVGKKLNIDQTSAALQSGYFPGKPEITAAVETVKPRLTAADLAGTDMLMSQYTTTFNAGDRGRTENVRLSALAIDGKVLMPGESFSFNAMTGRRTPKKGYQIAQIFVRKPGQTESEIVDGVGGGVCQVSSTLYNAVRKTNDKTNKGLAITERNHHSLPVHYVPPGQDATVAWPHKDFRFRNKFTHPIYLRSEMSGSRLTVSVWGRVPG